MIFHQGTCMAAAGQNASVCVSPTMCETFSKHEFSLVGLVQLLFHLVTLLKSYHKQARPCKWQFYYMGLKTTPRALCSHYMGMRTSPTAMCFHYMGMKTSPRALCLVTITWGWNPTPEHCFPITSVWKPPPGHCFPITWIWKPPPEHCVLITWVWKPPPEHWVPIAWLKIVAEPVLWWLYGRWKLKNIFLTYLAINTDNDISRQQSICHKLLKDGCSRFPMGKWCCHILVADANCVVVVFTDFGEVTYVSKWDEF